MFPGKHLPEHHVCRTSIRIRPRTEICVSVLCPSGCNIRRLLDHSGGGFRDLIIIQINLRACKEVAFSQTEQKPRIHLNAAVTVFAGVFSARIVFVGAISDAIEVLNRIFVGEGTEDTETVTFEEKRGLVIRFRPPLNIRAIAIGTIERRWVVSLGFIRNVIKALPPTNKPKSGV